MPKIFIGREYQISNVNNYVFRWIVCVLRNESLVIDAFWEINHLIQIHFLVFIFFGY